MPKHIWNSFLWLLCLALTGAGCATTTVQVVDVTTIDMTGIVPPTSLLDEGDALVGIDAHSLSPLATRVQWPEKPATGYAAYNIASGKENGVWVEGRAFFRRSLDAIYGDLITPQIIGPLHMTNDFDQSGLSETPELTVYVLHVRMRYIMSIAFDLSWQIVPIVSGGLRVGYEVRGEKTEGSRHIERISNRFIILQLDDEWVSVEVQSLNRATMDKEDESRAYVEGLFARWEALSQPPSDSEVLPAP
ncbi:MAG: hypothetical protein FWC40_01795 [Proteobacteria bacterium]|nr:hypothetical protein [Pseudomonadota bacterium]